MASQSAIARVGALIAIGQFPDVPDLPHLAGEGDDVGRVADKIE